MFACKTAEIPTDFLGQAGSEPRKILLLLLVICVSKGYDSATWWAGAQTTRRTATNLCI